MKEHGNSNPLAGNCVGCVFSGQASSFVHCAYNFITGERRPCPPGDKCTVRRNRKRGRRGKLLVHDGQKHSISEWGEILNIKPKTIRNRLDKGKSVEEALVQVEKKGGGNG